MLQKVLITKDDKIIYRREFGKAMGEEELKFLLMQLKKEVNLDLTKNLGNYISFQNRLSYIIERDFNLFFILISGLGDEPEDIEIELKEFRNEFLNIFGEVLTNTIDSSLLELLNPIVDKIFVNLRPKISLIGFSGVGKTTISKLIREEEIPTVHVPTITGKRSIIKIGKLQFILWDFAGQEQFSYLWNSFIEGSDAALLITDSTLENAEKSKFFIELIHEEAPYANSAIIANKQDLPGALKPDELEKILGLKAYSMVAIDPKNREKMIRIISEILAISTESSPLLRPIFERDLLILDAQNAYDRGNYDNALCYFEKIATICLELGDDSLGKEYYEKAHNLRIQLSENSFPPAQVSEIPEEPEMPEITEPNPSPTQISDDPEVSFAPEVLKNTDPLPESHEKLKTSTTLDSIDAIEIPENLQNPIEKNKTKKRFFHRRKKAR
ncbi:MAG: GTP-binding protein [Promethearchaeota archaeon]|nr:MAG: GTP-binding protein [Candidatus Lokiarchaeota archaeon]